MAVIAEQHDSPSCLPGFMQQHGQAVNRFASPHSVDLIAFGKMIVDCVDDDTDDLWTVDADFLTNNVRDGAVF